MDDLISRQEALDAIFNVDLQIYEGVCAVGRRNYMTKEEVCSIINSLPSAQQWHVIKKHPMTNDERIEWSEKIGYDIEYEDAFIYSNLPDDGEEVLVSSQYGNVYVDKFCQDEGCYFEENGDMDGIVAWMPLPKPYKEEQK